MGNFVGAPIQRLNREAHRCGRVTCNSLAAALTTNCPSSRIPTTDGVSTSSWALGISFGAPLAKIAQSEFVVPRSIPTIVPMYVNV
jgi:hypothetical protein